MAEEELLERIDKDIIKHIDIRREKDLWKPYLATSKSWRLPSKKKTPKNLKSRLSQVEMFLPTFFLD